MTNSADPDQLASDHCVDHCLLTQDMSCSAREGLTVITLGKIFSRRQTEMFFLLSPCLLMPLDTFLQDTAQIFCY